MNHRDNYLLQENKWMREKLSSLCIELMAVSVDVEAILSYRLSVAPDNISMIAARLHDMSERLDVQKYMCERLSNEGFE